MPVMPVQEEPVELEQPPPPAPPPDRAPRRGGLAVAQVLRHREFAIFWVGLAVSMIGTWMQGFAQGLVVTEMTTDAFALGLINFFISIPTLLLMPAGGVAADRLERRRILMVTQWVMAGLAALTGFLIGTHHLHLWHLYVIALLLGIATAYDLPAYQAFYPQLVEREDLPQAISLNQATFHGSRIVGPALAPGLIALLGMAAAFYANALSFLAVVVSLCFIRRRPPAASGAGRSAGSMMREGVAYVRERAVLQSLLGVTGITTFFVFPNLAVLMPFYALHVLNVGKGGLGALMSLSAVGSLSGSLLLLNVPHHRRTRSIALAAMTVAAMCSVLAWSKALWVSVLGCTALSLGIAFSVGLASVMVQEMVPEEMRGRVMSLYSLMFTGVMPFAALIIPKLTDVIGMRLELQLAAVLYGCGMAFFVLRLRRSRVGE